jgi:hypothetical protein
MVGRWRGRPQAGPCRGTTEREEWETCQPHKLGKLAASLNKDFLHHAKQSNPKPGELWAWGGFGIRIFNLLTQEDAIGDRGRPGCASLTHVHPALRQPQQEPKTGAITGLAHLKLATGVGGLDWAEVEPLVVGLFGRVKIPVFVYAEHHTETQADEPEL